ncbi:MAG: aminopeptidase [Armatimonadetes bacterium]|nr:aminopeptidase [Armatimonadota bacterium]
MDLLKSAEIALRDCLGVKKGEQVLIITDEPLRKIGQIFWEKAKELLTEAILLEIIPRKTSGEEPPPLVAQALKTCDVFVIPTSKSLTHTKARREANKSGARGATLPSITEDIMKRTLSADYIKIAKRSQKIAEILNQGRIVKITTPAGTKLTFSIEGREADPDTGLYLKKGDFGNLPAGEAYVAPIEGTAEGILVVDGAMVGGIINQPIIMKVEQGFVTDIGGNGEATLKLKEMLKPFDKLARNIAEFGVGTNDQAIITGNVLEDEKVMGTVHIALGNNLHFGGKVDVPLYSDGILLSPTVEIDGKIIIQEGKYLI